MAEIRIEPQPGPQELFLASPADIAIYGGGAGGGKTWALLVEPLRHIQHGQFGAVIFRRTYAQVTQQGGLWAKSEEIYPLLAARPNLSSLTWRFPSGAEVGFSHLQHEKDKLNYQGAEIALLCFDELTHFTESQFFYLLSRNRSMCGVRPYVRATTNPDADSWVARFIAWWIDQETGYPIPERAGKLRWFTRVGDDILWADTPEELTARNPQAIPKSVTFIPASLDDNPALVLKDPGYRANLLALPLVERERLLGGNWRIRPSAGLYFKRHWFKVLEAAPADIVAWVRYWDRAATEAEEGKDPDWTVGVLMGKTREGQFVVAHVERLRGTPLEVERAVRNLAEQDRTRLKNYQVGIEQDPGQAGKFEASYYARLLAGFNVRFYPARQDKLTRSQPFSAQCEVGNVAIVRGDWNEPYLHELEGFPLGAHDDQVDASSGAFSALASPRPSVVTEAMLRQAKR